MSPGQTADHGQGNCDNVCDRLWIRHGVLQCDDAAHRLTDERERLVRERRKRTVQPGNVLIQCVRAGERLGRPPEAEQISRSAAGVPHRGAVCRAPSTTTTTRAHAASRSVARSPPPAARSAGPAPPTSRRVRAAALSPITVLTSTNSSVTISCAGDAILGLARSPIWRHCMTTRERVEAPELVGAGGWIIWCSC